MINRRNFIKWVYRFFLGMWGAGAITAILSYLKAPKITKSATGNWVYGGKLFSIKIGEGELISHALKPFWLLRISEKQVIAISAICTHLQCIVKWNSNKKTLVCPCHQGEFNTDGNVISGLPPKPLPLYKVEIRGDDIYVII